MNLTEFLSAIRGWTGFEDTDVHSDALLTSWVRMAEELISREMRCSDMLQIDTALVVVDRAPLPPDWRASDFARVVDGKEIKYLPRGEFYALNNKKGYFTTSGLYIIVGDATPTTSKTLELHYFGDVPPLDTDASNWVTTRYLTVITAATMVFASTKMMDDGEEIKWQNKFDKYVADVNKEFYASIGSGSRLNRRIRSFG